MKISNKEYLDRFCYVMKLKEFSADCIHDIPEFSKIKTETIINYCMSGRDKNSPYINIIFEDPTQNLGLYDGYILGTKLKLPDNFPVKNDGYCYIFFVTFIENDLTQKEIIEAVRELNEKQFDKELPFSYEMNCNRSPIFNLIFIPNPAKDIKNSISIINYNQPDIGPIFNDQTDVIRNIVINVVANK